MGFLLHESGKVTAVSCSSKLIPPSVDSRNPDLVGVVRVTGLGEDAPGDVNRRGLVGGHAGIDGDDRALALGIGLIGGIVTSGSERSVCSTSRRSPWSA